MNEVSWVDMFNGGGGHGTFHSSLLISQRNFIEVTDLLQSAIIQCKIHIMFHNTVFWVTMSLSNSMTELDIWLLLSDVGWAFEWFWQNAQCTSQNRLGERGTKSRVKMWIRVRPTWYFLPRCCHDDVGCHLWIGHAFSTWTSHNVQANIHSIEAFTIIESTTLIHQVIWKMGEWSCCKATCVRIMLQPSHHSWSARWKQSVLQSGKIIWENDVIRNHQEFKGFTLPPLVL